MGRTDGNGIALQNHPDAGGDQFPRLGDGKFRLDSGATMGRTRKISLKTHEHEWLGMDRGVIGTFQKGNREVVRIKGDYEMCVICMAGRFIPEDKSLQIVECIKI